MGVDEAVLIDVVCEGFTCFGGCKNGSWTLLWLSVSLKNIREFSNCNLREELEGWLKLERRRKRTGASPRLYGVSMRKTRQIRPIRIDGRHRGEGVRIKSKHLSLTS